MHCIDLFEDSFGDPGRSADGVVDSRIVGRRAEALCIDAVLSLVSKS